MSQKEFKAFWESKYPSSLPIGHELRYAYKKRWFRIHSLPNSKRYADTDEEYQIIFDRQNQIIEDILGEEIILLFILYTNELSTENYKEIDEFSEFQQINTLEIQEIRQEENEQGLTIFIKEINWVSHKRNGILKAIADDKIRMALISSKKNRLICPYDGGVDLILESKEVKDFYKKKYSRWLSNHPEGF